MRDCFALICVLSRLRVYHSGSIHAVMHDDRIMEAAA